ncbi:hypothetical protein FA95DRAFT_1577660 [Auriscalpium vulgare]|uniref:Uncharacterized protein n=1 Tax=Auriscalpium vulgare TaxID=40419 RepID=A0ACB8R5M1_9AGAM|nr:hypothetical protein FA95DRAFT_1577660 [Auriscalpium vulgare]
MVVDFLWLKNVNPKFNGSKHFRVQSYRIYEVEETARIRESRHRQLICGAVPHIHESPRWEAALNRETQRGHIPHRDPRSVGVFTGSGFSAKEDASNRTWRHLNVRGAAHQRSSGLTQLGGRILKCILRPKSEINMEEYRDMRMLTAVQQRSFWRIRTFLSSPDIATLARFTSFAHAVCAQVASRKYLRVEQAEVIDRLVDRSSDEVDGECWHTECGLTGQAGTSGVGGKTDEGGKSEIEDEGTYVARFALSSFFSPTSYPWVGYTMKQPDTPPPSGGREEVPLGACSFCRYGLYGDGHVDSLGDSMNHKEGWEVGHQGRTRTRQRGAAPSNGSAPPPRTNNKKFGAIICVCSRVILNVLANAVVERLRYLCAHRLCFLLEKLTATPVAKGQGIAGGSSWRCIKVILPLRFNQRLQFLLPVECLYQIQQSKNKTTYHANYWLTPTIRMYVPIRLSGFGSNIKPLVQERSPEVERRVVRLMLAVGREPIPEELKLLRTRPHFLVRLQGHLGRCGFAVFARHEQLGCWLSGLEWGQEKTTQEDHVAWVARDGGSRTVIKGSSHAPRPSGAFDLLSPTSLASPSSPSLHPLHPLKMSQVLPSGPYVTGAILAIAPSIAPAKNVSSRRPFQFYVVARGSSTGLFDDWLIASPLVTGFPGAQFRGCHSWEEAMAAYHTAMEALPTPPIEHPLSLVHHFADPENGSEGSAIDDQDQPSEPLTLQPPPYGPTPSITPAAQPAPAPSTSVAQPAPLTSVAQPALSTSVTQPALTPSVAQPVPSNSAAVASARSSHNASSNEADASATTAGSLRIPRPQPGTYREEDLDELEEQMRQLNVDDMLDFLSGRRVPGSSAASDEQPIVMTVSLARNPNPGQGEGAFRILVRTNLSVGSPQTMDVGMLNESAQDAAAVLPPVAVEDADNDNDGDGGYSTAPHSPIQFASGSLPSDVSNISLVSTPSASLSLSSVTTSSVAHAAAGPGDTRETSALDAAINAPRILVRGSPAWRGGAPTATRPRAPTGAQAFPSSGQRTPQASTSHASSSSARPSAASDNKWFAVARGHVQGVFRGPLTNIIPFIVDFPGAFFAAFSTRAAAVDWFIEHEV